MPKDRVDPERSDAGSAAPLKAQLSRRTVAGAAAWAVPAVAAAAVAPPVSASACVPDTFLVQPEVDTAYVPYDAGPPEVWAQATVYKTTPMVITIPPYGSTPCPITYTIRGGDGSNYGGGGITATGTITRSDPNKALTLTLVAGAHGELGDGSIQNQNYGGVGYGKGGDGTWLGSGPNGTGNNHAIGATGGGGGGSAIMVGVHTDPNQTSSNVLIVAAGGGGGGGTWADGGTWQASGVFPAGAPIIPGTNTNTAAYGQLTSMDGIPERPFGRIYIGDPANTSVDSAALGYTVGSSTTAAAPAQAGQGTDGKDGAHVSTSNGSGSYAGYPYSLNGTATAGVWTYTHGTGTITSQYTWNSPGLTGGNHGTGMYGGGNGGGGNTTPPTGAPNNLMMYVPGAGGGGGFAGGGGGLSISVEMVSNLGTARGSMSSAGAAGSSYLATSLSNPNGGTVTATATWTKAAQFADQGSVAAQHGYVQITVG